jgi:hypothetical protein
LSLPLRYYPVTAFLATAIVFIISSQAVFGLQENINNSNLSYANGSAEEPICPEQNCTIMHPSFEELIRWTELYANAPQVVLEPRIMDQLNASPGASYSLLSHLQYTPSQRNQGSCGNCWAWAGTGVMEVALDVQRGIKDRLSVQYLNSYYNGGSGSSWACCGGWLDDVTTFYSGAGKAIPWSNTNAQWQDGGRTCGSGSTIRSGSTISTSPNYPITSIQTVSIPTFGVGKTQAILNIKNVLNQGKAVWFAFFMPTSSDWSTFGSFWSGQSESAVWDPTYSCGKTWASGGGGHAVLCVGYDDTDPNNRYWIMLNSWGAPSQRPNGLFRVSMEMNYDGVYYYGSTALHSFFWQTANMVAAVPTAPALTNSIGANPISSNSARLNGEITSTGGENPTVHIYWGTNDGGTNAANWQHDENLGALGTGTFYRDITGLNRNMNYYYRCYAINSVGGVWASSTATLKTMSQFKLIGSDDTICEGCASANTFVLCKFQALSTGDINSIRLKASSVGNVKVAIYSDSGNQPGNIINKVDISTGVSSGWNDIRITKTYLVKDNYYWLAYISDNGIICHDLSSVDKFRYKPSTPYGTFTFPDSAGSGFNSADGVLKGIIAGWDLLPPIAPSVSNQGGATSITGCSARLNGNLTSSGGENSVISIYWGKSDQGTSWTSWDNVENIGGKSTGAFYKDITGLLPKTRYYYRCFASNSAGSNGAASSETFLTTSSFRIIGSDEANCEGSASGNTFVLCRFKALVNGDVDTLRVKASGNGNVKVAIYSDNAGQPGSKINSVDMSTPVVSGWNDISFTPTSLVKDNYYWLAYISDNGIICHDLSSVDKFRYRPSMSYGSFTFPNSAGTGFNDADGVIIGLVAAWHMMDPIVPTVINSNEISSNGIRLSGTVKSTGGERPSVKIYWGTTDGKTTPGNWQHVEDIGIVGVGTFYRNISGLSPNTVYYYRCYASNSAGFDWADGCESVTTAPP